MTRKNEFPKSSYVYDELEYQKTVDEHLTDDEVKGRLWGYLIIGILILVFSG